MFYGKHLLWWSVSLFLKCRNINLLLSYTFFSGSNWSKQNCLQTVQAPFPRICSQILENMPSWTRARTHTNTHLHTQPWRPTPKCLFSTQRGYMPGEVCDVIHRNWGNMLQLVHPACSNLEHHMKEMLTNIWLYDRSLKVLVYSHWINVCIYLRTGLTFYRCTLPPCWQVHNKSEWFSHPPIRLTAKTSCCFLAKVVSYVTTLKICLHLSITNPENNI